MPTYVNTPRYWSTPRPGTTDDLVMIPPGYGHAAAYVAEMWADQWHGTGALPPAAIVGAMAALWQSPGAIGQHLAALASGQRCNRGELLDDIALTSRQQALSPLDNRILASLYHWAVFIGPAK